MADKAISELLAANQVTPTDLFVLEQSGVAKKLTGQTLENWLLSFADGHGGIQSIVKKGTSGLVDTYRITLADTTTFDFTVTNGKAISSVGQTSVSGLTRTYTIAFNDGTSQTFKVTDGRSITNIAKTGTNGLTDTYTISYNDGTSSTFTVKNGKGIQSFAKVSTDGLVDTYRIEYNDGTFDEFTVTNGAKGDKGDNTYTHIKFASQEPTEASHSFGDVPDKWIGFYWGSSAAAPTDWTQYKWYQFKGDKGDTGSPATLTSAVVEYQMGNSGTIIPSEAWTASVPAVAQGKYLWTRTTQNFNTGSPVVSYSVSRMGLDGAGSVVSVNNVSPNAEGNVVLNAEDVGARPNTWMPSAEDVGAYSAIESTEHPGCFYRMVNGVQEWINPPMIPGVEYRTTGRYEGKPVYTEALTVACPSNGASKEIDFGTGRTITALRSVVDDNYPSEMPTINGDTGGVGLFAFYAKSTGKIYIQSTASYQSGGTCSIFVEYTKN